MFFVIIGVLVGILTLVGYIFMLLWNWIMPYLFKLPTINFWMAWGIMIFLGIITSCIRKYKK